MADKIREMWLNEAAEGYFSAFIYIVCVRVMLFGVSFGFGIPADRVTEGFSAVSLVPDRLWGTMVIGAAAFCIVFTMLRKGNAVLYSSMVLFITWLYLSLMLLDQGLYSLALIEFVTCIMFGWFYVSVLINRRWGFTPNYVKENYLQGIQ